MFSFDRRARLAAATVAVSLPASLLALTPAAQAATIGRLTMIPAAGHQDSALSVTTPAPCPAGATSFFTELSGPRIIGDPPSNGVISTSTRPLTDASPNGAGYRVEISEPLSSSFAQQAVTNPSGEYTVSLVCTDSSGFEVFGSFDALLNVTDAAGADPYALTYQQAAQVVATTTTTLVATPLDPIASGTATTLTATVAASDSSTAAGTVQFKRAGVNLGAPVAVSGGTATSPAITLPAGAAGLTADFVPADPAAHGASSSAALSYVVATQPTITGTVRVDETVTCATSAGGSQAFAWLVDGAVQATTTQTATIPADWATKQLACRVTVTSNGRSLPLTSAASTVAPAVVVVPATVTTTTLDATPLDPIETGTTTTLTATVTAADSSNAVGSVQFKRGGANLGAPVAVSGGAATSPAATFESGAGDLTADFIPADPASYAASSSAPLQYVVVSTPVISGNVNVDSSVTCVGSAGGTQAFAWLLDGAVQPVTTQTTTIPAAWAGKQLTCRVTVTSNGRSLARTSGATTVGPTLVVPPAAATATTLTATPLDPTASGTATTLTATVSATGAPAPAGTVQFKRGGANLGSPVALVGGTATSAATVLAAGEGNLTAVFAPANPAAYQASTSAALPYVVVAAPAVSGNARVGSSVTCATSAGGAQAIAWLVNGTVQAPTTRTVQVPSDWFGGALACRVTVTSNGRSLVRTSGTTTVTTATALKSVRPPRVRGVMQASNWVTCAHGAWSPAAASYSYQWKRDGVKLPGKVFRTYKLKPRDRGAKISCRVVAKKPGYANGVAFSARRVVR